MRLTIWRLLGLVAVGASGQGWLSYCGLGGNGLAQAAFAVVVALVYCFVYYRPPANGGLDEH